MKGDFADRSAALTDFYTEIALKNRKRDEGPKLTPTGLCHNCEDTVEPERIFCDAECRDDYEKYVLKRR